jgi:hypothetical protein
MRVTLIRLARDVGAALLISKYRKCDHLCEAAAVKKKSAAQDARRLQNQKNFSSAAYLPSLAI